MSTNGASMKFWGTRWVWTLCGLAAAALTAPAQTVTPAEERRAAREAQREAQRAAREGQQARREAERAEREAAQRSSRQAVSNQRTDQQQTCERIGVWLTGLKGVPAEAQSRRFGGGNGTPNSTAAQLPYEAWLFQDAHFLPTFGHRFDAVPADERARLQRGGMNCHAPRNTQGQAIADSMLFYRAFDDRYHPRYAQGVVKIREAHAQMDDALQQLKKPGTHEDGAKAFREHAARAQTLALYLGPEQRAAYRAAIAEGFQRSVLPFHAQRLRQAGTSAQGYDGLMSLVAVQADLARDAQLAGAPAHLPPEWRARMAELAQGVVAHEKTRIDALGQGLAGLERGVQWHQEHARRFDARATDAVPELRQMRVHFEARRAAVLDAAAPELADRVAQTRSADELTQLLQRYVPLPSDPGTRGGAALFTRVAAHRDELHKRSLIGSGPAAPAPSVAQRPPAREAGPARPVARGSGEPSESEMYDAFNDRLQAMNTELQRTAESCNRRDYNRAGGDPVLALQCLQFGVGVGTTAGGQGVVAPQYKLSRFEKIACEKAQSESGYWCDYVSGIAGNMKLPPSLDGLLRNGELTQARFVRRSEGGWLIIPRRR